MTKSLSDLPPKTMEALSWIIGVLNRHKVPFQISGGLAAKIYGSPRPLNDIDLDIPEWGFEVIKPDITPFLIFGPDRYVDERWDLMLATLTYHGQDIDIGGCDCRIFDDAKRQWFLFPSNLSTSTPFTIAGLVLPVMIKADLLAYKQLLKGDHQRIDRETLMRGMNNLS